MKTRIEGHTKDSILITSGEEQRVVECQDAIVKLWLSSGTILGIKYGNMLYPNIWKIRVIYGPVDKHYDHYFAENLLDHFDSSDCCLSDVFETEEEVIMMQVIPRTHYKGDK